MNDYQSTGVKSAYAKELGARLRKVRERQGLSLHGVEEKSGGKWKAVVVGSYERADRGLTVDRLALLAEFYGAQVADLLPGELTTAEAKPEPEVDELAAVLMEALNPGAMGLDGARPMARKILATGRVRLVRDDA